MILLGVIVVFKVALKIKTMCLGCIPYIDHAKNVLETAYSSLKSKLYTSVLKYILPMC